MKKKVGLCHGVFDVVHYGHILHFELAKSKVDKLIVSVTKDKFVNKGSGRPIFNTKQRINYLQNIKSIDEVIHSESNSAIDSLKKIKPDIFFKGEEYSGKNKITLNLFEKEKKFCAKSKIKIFYTNEKTFSSSKIINFYNKYDDVVLKKINTIKKKYNFLDIVKIFNDACSKKITIIGDPIIDSYTFCESVGTASKSPTLALLKNYSEEYLGGSLAVAKMFENLSCKAELISYIPQKKYEILKDIKNLKTKILFKSKKYPVIHRIVDRPRSVKLMQIYNEKKIDFSLADQEKVIQQLRKANKSLLIIIDFGFGLMSEKVIDYLNMSKIKQYLNCHINSLNLTTNYYEKYKNFSYITFNKREFELSFKGEENFNQKIFKAKKIIRKDFAVTVGSNGSYQINKKKVNYFPSIYKEIVDPIGCGDAFFVMTSLIKNVSKDQNLINFMGNLYAGMHAMHEGNKKFTDKTTFLNTMKSILS